MMDAKISAEQASLAAESQPRPESDRRGDTVLADALQVLGSTRDRGAACAIVAACAVRYFSARECRVLRAEPSSASLYAIDESGAETPYLPEPGGAVAAVLERETSCEVETSRSNPDPLWSEPAAAATALPLCSAGTLYGVLALSFDTLVLDDTDRGQLHALADALALGLERAALIEQLEDARARNAHLAGTLSAGEESSNHLLTVLAQEIRTPLTSIKAYAEVLLDRLHDTRAPRERFIGVIGQECERLRRLVVDLLEFARLDAKRRPLRLARFALDQLVEKALVEVMPVASARQVEFEIDIDAALVVEVDSDLLRGALVHMAWNAVAFSPIPGKVRIAAKAQGENCLCSIDDQGEGFPDEELPHLFDRFYSSRESESLPGEAHALGLAVAKQIVQAHGGRVWAERAEQGGTRLCVELPRLQVAPLRARRIARRIARGTELRRLFRHLVDEAASATDALSISLMWVDAELGDLVIVATQGSDASQLVGRHAPIRSGVAGSVAAWGEPVVIGDINSDRRFEKLNHPQYASKSLMSVPVRVAGEILGVLNLTNKASGQPFSERDLEAVKALVCELGRALERAFTHGSERVLEGPRAVGLLAGVCAQPAPKRDRDSVELSLAVARELGLDYVDTERITHVAALLHADVEGAGAQGDDRGHTGRMPDVHREMLRPSGYLARLQDVMSGLSARWDGVGVPSRLSGDAIPIGSRVLAVVSAYVRGLEGTPFRARRSRDEALAVLREEAGKRFDPSVVEAFERALHWQEGA